jgi:hypothetical protein
MSACDRPVRLRAYSDGHQSPPEGKPPVTSEELVSRETPTAEIAEYAGETWETMVSQAVEVFGADLESGNAVVGVPFMAVKATIRPGEYMNAITKQTHPYASLDIIIAPDAEIAKGLARGRITPPLTVSAGEHLVINEAGTGAYRQVVQTLEALGMIGLPEGPETGAFGESRFDSLASAWTVVTGSVQPSTAKDGGEPTLAFDIRLYCPRGLRVSEYENEYTKTGVTRYIG